MNNVAKMKDNELLKQFSQVVGAEREATIDVVVHLAEIAKRQLYAKEGYASLFRYVTEKHHMSEGAAYRRIQAAKVYRRYEKILGFIQEGKVNLTTVGLIERHLTPKNGEELIKMIIGKSKRQVEDELSRRFSNLPSRDRDVIRKLPVQKNVIKKVNEDPKRGVEILKNFRPSFGQRSQESAQGTPEVPKRALWEHKLKHFAGEVSIKNSHLVSIENKMQKSVKVVRKVKIEFVASEVMAKKIERAKEILGHTFPAGKLEQIFNQALEDLLDRRDPWHRMIRINKRKKRSI